MRKICNECQTEFDLSEKERTFLEKVSPEFGGIKYPFPEPNFCPICRLAHRTLHRNEQFFHHNKSMTSGKPLISLYSPDASFSKDYKISSYEEWWSEKWDATEYGRDYDFNRSFFDQFNELHQVVPRLNLMQIGNENSKFTTGTGYCKNCYLINCSENCEDCYYGKLYQGCRDVMDSAFCYDSELLYECFSVTNCYNCVYLSYSQNSNDCWFSENLKGCKNCLLSTNLQNKEYYVLNKPVSKEQFEVKLKDVLATRERVEQAKKILAEMRRERVHKYSNIVNCENSSGDFLVNCKNCTDCYDVNDSEDCAYVTVGVQAKDIMDCSNMYLKPQLSYQVLGTIETYNVHFSLYIFHSQNVFYSESCFYSQNLFGCVGLRNKKYCIFNKQYTKEEYEELVPKIAQHMQKTNQWGQYFPAWTSPFGYNETVAQEYVPLTKEQAVAKGYHWQEPDQREFKPATYTPGSSIADVTEEVMKEMLKCNQCGKNYRIIQQELQRLKQLHLPLPLHCPDCRLRDRMQLRNPRTLYDRTCEKCGDPIKTPYSSTRPEQVLCEKCYLEAVF